jgi:hypothetical protein
MVYILYSLSKLLVLLVFLSVFFRHDFVIFIVVLIYAAVEVRLQFIFVQTVFCRMKK